MLVRKVYGDHNRRHKSRNWKLQQLNKEIEEDMSVESYDKYVLLLARYIGWLFSSQFHLTILIFSINIFYSSFLKPFLSNSFAGLQKNHIFLPPFAVSCLKSMGSNVSLKIL